MRQRDQLLPLAAIVMLLTAGSALAQTESQSEVQTLADPLREGFEVPPATARPRVWWHWMNGNVSIDGIEKDLAWLKRVGVGGVQNFDAGFGTPQIVPKRLVFMTPEWKAAFKHAVTIADREGMEFTIAASPGWSETGGPWVKPEDAMKKIAWSEKDLPGGKHFRGALPMIPNTIGPYQTALQRHSSGAPVPADKFPSEASRAIAVIAVPVTATPLPTPIVRTDTGQRVDAAALFDNDLETTVRVENGMARGTAPSALTLEYDSPVTIQSARLYLAGGKPRWSDSPYRPQLHALVDGAWEVLGDFPITTVSTTLSFTAVKARQFRVVFSPNPGYYDGGLGTGVPGADNSGRRAAPPPENFMVGDLRLSGEARVNRAEQKANFFVAEAFYPIWDHSKTKGLDPKAIIDLTDKVSAHGTLNWTPPADRDWRVLRIGWSLTGDENHPASPEGTGLEVDKFDPAAVRRYLETYIGMYRDTVGPELLGKRGLQAILTDSIEVGAANWTPDMFAAFKARRGYDARPWLPALLGYVVQSPDATERFLYDYRQTLSDLLSEAHYATVAKVAHENDLKVYGEALEGGRVKLGDDLAMRSYADIPMAAMWMFNRDEGPRTALVGDIKGAASVANIYGQNIVAAESLTSSLAPWGHTPSDMKRVIDLEFALGVNRPIIHTSVHQPSDVKVPGLSLGDFGQYFNRHDSWAPMARPWVDYLARSSFLLQQGHSHSDIAYFYGEETPVAGQFAGGIPDNLPVRFGYDFVNAQMLAGRVSVADGDIVVRAPGTGRYRALYLGGTSEKMTLATLRRISELVEAGAFVIGQRPSGSPNLLDDDAAFQALAAKLWTVGPETRFGKGRVVRALNPDKALLDAGVTADFDHSKPVPDTSLLFKHRKLADGDLYFITNRQSRREIVEARFGVTGKKPEHWNAVTRSVTPLSFRIEGNQTVVPLDLAPDESLFLVFREPTSERGYTVRSLQHRTIATLNNPWRITFQPGRGAPDMLDMPRLIPLEKNTDSGIRYFSGIATYNSSFTVPKSHKSGAPLSIDLGKVGDVAEVTVNGKPAGIAWVAPYRVDIGAFVKPGENQIEIKVANLWTNRLIGDKQPGATPVAFVTVSTTYNADAPLRPAGLIGPVTLISAETIPR